MLEVETPLLGRASVTAVHLHSFSCTYQPPFGQDLPGERLPPDESRLYLQTSPEYALKRLLAAGAGAIYQLGKVFRDGEAGSRHNPEFTMLEWYRPGWDYHRLMDEVDELLQRILGTRPAERASYRDVFRRHLGLDPHQATGAELRAVAARAGLDVEALGLEADDRDGWLDALMSLVVEPRLGLDVSGGRQPLLLHGYPASQAALARLGRDEEGTLVAERFEAYVDGVELANGYQELTDAAELRRRFEDDLEQRRLRGLPAVPLDERLLAAQEAGFLEVGLSACAGVSVGVDRLVMLAVGARRIEDVLTFPIDRA